MEETFPRAGALIVSPIFIKKRYSQYQRRSIDYSPDQGYTS
jgi:hypothetical protein